MNQFEIIGKVLLSGILSALIGFEREKHGREAGLRTTILVGMGTTAILLTSFQVYFIFSSLPESILRIDPGRIAYGIVPGIGFLGAGVIVKDRKRIRGLTTAACLWFVTAIGLAVGVGLYLFSIFLTFISIAILYLLKILEKKIPVDAYTKITIVTTDLENLIEEIERIILEKNFKILSKELERDKEKKINQMVLTLRYRTSSQKELENLLETIYKNENVKKMKII